MNKKEALTNLGKGLHYLQKKLGLRIYFGGKTALMYGFHLSYGISHPRQAFIFHDDPIPLWFKEHNWAETLNYDYPEFKVYYFQNDFLPQNIAYTLLPTESFEVWMSSYERAMMETIYLIKEYEDPFDVSTHMEYAFDMNPDLIQLLLENCTNNRVKRWFLYLSEKFEHSYYKELDLDKIPLGTEFIKDELTNVKAYEKKYNMEVQIDVFRRYNKEILKEELEFIKFGEQKSWN